MRRDGGELRRAPPVLGLQPLRRKLALHAVDVRIRNVHLVHGDDDRHLGGAGVRDRLLRLRHDAVVRRDDEHRDVGDLRAACAHGGERLVAGRVEERDPPTVDLGLVRTDVLRDPAGLGLDDRRLANRVEQRRLAVIDVAHDRYDRRPRDEVRLGVVVRRRLELLLRCALDRDLALELRSDDLDLLVGERLGRSPHLPETHEDLDQLRHRHPERLREVFDGDARLDGDRAGRRRCGRLARLRRRRRTIAGLATGAAAASALDDDAPLSPAGASAGSDRAIRSLASVCHQSSSLDPRRPYASSRASSAATSSHHRRPQRPRARLRSPRPPPPPRRSPRPSSIPRDRLTRRAPPRLSSPSDGSSAAAGWFTSAWCAGTPQ